MRILFTFILILNLTSLFAQNSTKEVDKELIASFKQEMKRYQYQFMEGILNLILCEDADDLFNARSYFVTQFAVSNSAIQDIIESYQQQYDPYRYRDVLVDVEVGSPVFSKSFKSDTSYYLNKLPTRIVDGDLRYSYYSGKIYLFEKLILSQFINESQINKPSFNAYSKGLLKLMDFEIEIQENGNHKVRIKSVKIIKDNEASHKSIVKRILGNGVPWSNIASDGIIGREADQADISIRKIDTVKSRKSFILEAYPTGGKWSGKGTVNNTQWFEPGIAYDDQKGGEQIVTIKYSFTYANGVEVSSNEDIVLGNELAPPDELKQEKLQTCFDPNFISLSELNLMGITGRSIKTIAKYRKKCKWILTPNQFFDLLNEEDEIKFGGEIYDYIDLEQALYKLLKFGKPRFDYEFDPNNLDSLQLTKFNVDTYSISEFVKYRKNGKTINSAKEFFCIGCFKSYRKQIANKIKFDLINLSIASLGKTDYLLPGYGQMKFANFDPNTPILLGRKARTIFYSGGFFTAVGYTIFNKVQAVKSYSKHENSITFRDANINLEKANKYQQEFRNGTYASAIFFIANIAHLNIMEWRNKKNMEADPVNRYGGLNLLPTPDGLSLTYTF